MIDCCALVDREALTERQLQREAETCRSVGFQTAVTIRHGSTFPEHLRHLHALRRVHSRAPAMTEVIQSQ